MDQFGSRYDVDVALITGKIGSVYDWLWPYGSSQILQEVLGNDMSQYAFRLVCLNDGDRRHPDIEKHYPGVVAFMAIDRGPWCGDPRYILDPISDVEQLKEQYFDNLINTVVSALADAFVDACEALREQGHIEQANEKVAIFNAEIVREWTQFREAVKKAILNSTR